MAKVAWIGEIHNDAMTDLTSNLELWVGSDYDNNARVCRGIANLTRKYVPRTNAHSGRVSSAERDRQLANAAVALARPECSAHLMSIFATHAPMFSRTSARITASTTQSELSADYDYHSERLIAAIEATDGSVSAVASAGDQALNSAWGVGQVDFEALAALVTVANSSAVQWNDYASSGGFDGVALDVEPMSMFGTVFPWWIVRLVASDAVGCYFGHKAGGTKGACADGALAASALYLISIL